MTIYGSFALEPSQTATIPDIAVQIPDFDSSVSLQIFANSTQSEIGCFQASMRNGNSLGIPAILAPTIAFFVAIAIITSFATASYGISVPLMRAHYAHSLSVLLVMETLQTIFFTGALSLHWPSVLVAWWSNFAWSAGLINISPLVAQIGSFSGVAGNASQVGNAGPMFVNNGGGRLAGQIYGTTDSNDSISARGILQQNNTTFDRSSILDAAYSLIKRKLYNSSDPYDYTWGGDPVLPGVPLPGTWQSFSGTIGELDIPGASAFTLSFIWMVIAIVIFPAAILAVRGLFELLARFGWVRQDCMAYFRTHSGQYARQGLFRVLLIAFPPLMTLAIFQLTLHTSPGSTTLAALVVGGFLAGLAFVCTQAVRKSPKAKKHYTEPTGQRRRPAFSVLSFAKRPAARRNPSFTKGKYTRRISYVDDEETRYLGVHQDDAYIKQFGWLTARYKARCWWFFVVYLCTQFARACILGGGADNDSNIDTSNGNTFSSGPPTAQVVVFLVFEILAFACYAYWRPFESTRNTALGVWVLGVGRVVVAALCIGLLPQTGLSRIGATVIGFVIIVVQVLMLAVVVVLVAMSMVSTWLSLTRNQDDFYSEMFFSLRKRYLETLLANATGAPPPPTRRQQRKQEKATRLADLEAERIAASLPRPEPSFSVMDVRRTPKIEDVHYADSDSEVEGFGVDGFIGYFGRDAKTGQSGSSGSGMSGSGGSGSRGSSTNGDGHGSSSTSKGGARDSIRDVKASIAENDDDDIDHDILGDLGDLTAQSTKRRRANSGGFGSAAGHNTNGAGLVGAQIYDPARVIARLNRSRTNSTASLRSVPSAQDSMRRVSEMSALSGLSGPQIGALAGRRSASPFGGGRSFSPYDGTAVGMTPSPLLHGLPGRSSSVPPVLQLDVAVPSSGRATPSTAGPVSRRMTPTRETLQRYSSERQSVQSLRSTSVPDPVPE